MTNNPDFFPSINKLGMINTGRIINTFVTVPGYLELYFCPYLSRDDFLVELPDARLLSRRRLCQNVNHRVSQLVAAFHQGPPTLTGYSFHCGCGSVLIKNTRGRVDTVKCRKAILHHSSAPVIDSAPFTSSLAS